MEWHEFFMAAAFLVAKRSKDPVSQVGACIVNSEKKIVATGYNGMPTGCGDDDFPWAKHTENPLDSKFLYGILFISTFVTRYNYNFDVNHRITSHSA